MAQVPELQRSPLAPKITKKTVHHFANLMVFVVVDNQTIFESSLSTGHPSQKDHSIAPEALMVSRIKWREKTFAGSI